MTLTERIDQAIDRIIAGHSPQRIPADLTDPDIVLTDCKARIAELEAELADAVDYGRGRHEAGRPSPPSPEALAKAMRGGMHAAFAQGGESVECACSSCTNRRAALAEWEKP